MTVNTGECADRDSYGIMFRVPVFREADRGYLYEVSCDGYYKLWSWDGKAGENGKSTTLVWWAQPKGDAAGAINIGPDQVNRLGVKTQGDTITLYINGFLVHQIKDDSWPAGHFGVIVNPDGSKKYTVKIDDMRYWLLP